MHTYTRASAAAVAIAIALAHPAAADPPSRSDGVIPVVNGPGPVDCRALGYGFDLLQNGTLSFTDTIRSDGTRIRHAELVSTVYRADEPSRTLELRGRYQSFDDDGVRRLVGLVRSYTLDGNGEAVLRRVGREVIDLSTRPPTPLYGTPFAGPQQEAAGICAALA